VRRVSHNLDAGVADRGETANGLGEREFEIGISAEG
jgi:hypothetical protein